MVAYAPDRLAAILTGAAGGPFRKMSPARVHTLVIWTRDFRNLLHHENLKKAAAECGQVYLHLTVTGLAKTAMEPQAPRPSDFLPHLDDLIVFLGSAERICLRYDPLVTAEVRGETLSNLNLDLFMEVAGSLAKKGVRRVVTSVVTPYPKVINRIGSVPGPDPRTAAPFIEAMKTAARGMNMKLDTCCSPPGTRGCLDADLLESLHPRREPVPSGPNPAQREGCRCCASWDVGWYRGCPAGCLYCYARS